MTNTGVRAVAVASSDGSVMPMRSTSATTASRVNRRCPPAVVDAPIRPFCAHWRTVTGETPSSVATSDGVSSVDLRRLDRRIEPEIDDALLAHAEFLDLAGHCHRELVDEADVARHLVVRDLA